MARLVICNAPSWFNSFWSVVARVLPESVRKKITIMAGVKGLDDLILPSQRPVEFGGTDIPLGQAPQHLAFLQLAKDWEMDRSERGMGSESGSQAGTGYRSSQSSAGGSVQGGSSGRERDSSGRRKKPSRKKRSGSVSSTTVRMPICVCACVLCVYLCVCCVCVCVCMSVSVLCICVCAV